MDNLDHTNDPRQQYRRDKLRELIDSHYYGKTSIFVKAMGESRAYESLVSQYLKGARGITEKTIDKIEQALGKPGYFATGEASAHPAEGAAVPTPASSGAGIGEVTQSEGETMSIAINSTDLSTLIDLHALSEEDATLIRAQIRALAHKNNTLVATGKKT